MIMIDEKKKVLVLIKFCFSTKDRKISKDLIITIETFVILVLEEEDLSSDLGDGSELVKVDELVAVGPVDVVGLLEDGVELVAVKLKVRDAGARLLLDDLLVVLVVGGLVNQGLEIGELLEHAGQLLGDVLVGGGQALDDGEGGVEVVQLAAPLGDLNELLGGGLPLLGLGLAQLVLDPH